MDAAVKKNDKAVEAPPTEEKPAALPTEIIIDLSKPVMAHGEMISKIKFRLPTGGDLMAMGDGYPILIEWQTGRVTPNPPVMGAMMSLLAGVPPSTIKMLAASDFSTCSFRLMGFFTPGEQAIV